MHGLINKAVEAFVTDTYGQSAWHAVLRRAGLWDQIGSDGFDTLHVYDAAVFVSVLAAASDELARPSESLLEDLGTYLVSHHRTGRLRRLLRFGGVSYTEFLRSLVDLEGRVRLAVPDLALPALTLTEQGPGLYQLTCHACHRGFGDVMLGLLRAMGDDYGALVVLDLLGRTSTGSVDDRPGDGPGGAAETGDDMLSIIVHDTAFHAGREFELTVPGAA
jgi:hypothetical protein